MPGISASGAPGGALGWGTESARVEPGVVLEKQSKKLHLNIAGIQETMETVTSISVLQNIIVGGVR